MSSLRPLAGLRIGISVAAAEDLATRGFTEDGMNRLTIRLARRLLDEGATLCFGHDWRHQGIMDAICRAALDSFGFPGKEDAAPMILNLVPWPDKTEIPGEVLERLQGILQVEPAGLPDDLEQAASSLLASESAADASLMRYLRARGLSYLRRRLTQESQARICLGGKERSFSGRYPGILEEAAFTLEGKQPLYLVGLLGGAALRVGAAILDGAEQPPGSGEDAFRQPDDGTPPLADLYERYSTGSGLFSLTPSRPSDLLDDRVLDLAGAWDLVRRLGSTRLAGVNGLSREENQRLLHTGLEDEALYLIVTGLRRLQKPSESVRRE
ncbi:MAG: hypothetical protein M3O15_00380 [Acidobacteriota bacterium]|nr:hypothetical protein [Acidobacteriota bacterium]